MNCFQFLKLRQNKIENNENFRKYIDKVNEILHKNNKPKLNDIQLKFNLNEIEFGQNLCSTLFELILNDFRTNNLNNLNFLNDLFNLVQNSNWFNVNNIKNFLNQTLLHFACENNERNLCKLLVKNGADCFAEDNYLQTPFILAAKRNYIDILRIFCASIHQEKCQTQILKATYYASCSGHYEIVEFLFDKFKIHTETLIDLKDNSINKISELNPLHVCCYKCHFKIVDFLISSFKDPSVKSKYINTPFNEYRDSTSLEEALKGFISMNAGFNLNKKNLNELKQENEEKIKEYKQLINLLIDNGARFSINFALTNGLVKLMFQSFSGIRKDTDFLHFLYCCNFLFKFKLSEIFNFDSSEKPKSQGEDNESKYFLDTKSMIEDFLFQVYSICCKVIKDHKAKCLNMYIDIVLTLYHTGILKFQPVNFEYMKAKNGDLFDFLASLIGKPLTLKNLSSNTIRDSIKHYSIHKVNRLNVQNDLKNEVFYSVLSREFKQEFDYHTYLVLKSINYRPKI